MNKGKGGKKRQAREIEDDESSDENRNEWALREKKRELELEICEGKESEEKTSHRSKKSYPCGICKALYDDTVVDSM